MKKIILNRKLKVDIYILRKIFYQWKNEKLIKNNF